MAAGIFGDIVSDNRTKEDKKQKVVLERQPEVEHRNCSESGDGKRYMDTAVQVKIKKLFDGCGEFNYHQINIKVNKQ